MASGYPSAVQNHGDLCSHRLLRDIGGPCDNLYRRILPHIHLADHQLVRIRMALHGENLSHYDFFKVFVKMGVPFHLGSGQGHGIRIFLGGHVQIRHIGLNP